MPIVINLTDFVGCEEFLGSWCIIGSRWYEYEIRKTFRLNNFRVNYFRKK